MVFSLDGPHNIVLTMSWSLASINSCDYKYSELALVIRELMMHFIKEEHEGFPPWHAVPAKIGKRRKILFVFLARATRYRLARFYTYMTASIIRHFWLQAVIVTVFTRK